MNTRKLQELVAESKLTKSEICSKCGFTRPTLDNAMSGGDVKISTVISLANFFKVSISYFFDEESLSDVSSELARCKKEIQYLNDIINGRKKSTRLVIEVDVDPDEFVKIKEKAIQILRSE